MYSFLSIFFILKSWNRGAEDWVITKDKSNVHAGQAPVTLEKSLTNKDKAVFKCHLFCCDLLVEVGLKNPGKKENSRSVEECWRARSPPLYKSHLCVSLLKYFSHMNHLTKFKQPRVNRMIFSNPLLAIYIPLWRHILRHQLERTLLL